MSNQPDGPGVQESSEFRNSRSAVQALISHVIVEHEETLLRLQESVEHAEREVERVIAEVDANRARPGSEFFAEDWLRLKIGDRNRWVGRPVYTLALAARVEEPVTEGGTTPDPSLLDVDAPGIPLYLDENVTDVSHVGSLQNDEINGLRARIGQGGYLSNQVWNMRNRYLSSAASRFTAAEVRSLVEGFLAEIAAVTSKDQRDTP